MRSISTGCTSPCLSTAGTAFAAVQRIVTGRWSRPIVRFTEGFVAFVPVAFVILLVILLFGRDHIFTWAGREAITVQEKAAYLAPGFFLARGIILFGADHVPAAVVRVQLGPSRRGRAPGVRRQVGGGHSRQACAPASATSAASCIRSTRCRARSRSP